MKLYNFYYFYFLHSLTQISSKKSLSEHIFSKLNPEPAKLNRSRCNRKKVHPMHFSAECISDDGCIPSALDFQPSLVLVRLPAAPTMSSPLQRDLLFGDSVLLSYRCRHRLHCNKNAFFANIKILTSLSYDFVSFFPSSTGSFKVSLSLLSVWWFILGATTNTAFG